MLGGRGSGVFGEAGKYWDGGIENGWGRGGEARFRGLWRVKGGRLGGNIDTGSAVCVVFNGKAVSPVYGRSSLLLHTEEVSEFVVSERRLLFCHC